MKIGFALICQSPFFEEVIKIENQIHQSAGFFDSLGANINLPHTTLFQGEMDDTIDYAEIAKKIALETKRLIPNLKITFSKVVYVPEGWYFLECEKTEALQRLHNFTLKLVEPYIVLTEGRLKRNTRNMPRNQIDALKNYGYRYAGSAFHPHITVGRATEKNEDVILKLNNAFGALDKNTSIGRITVYKMGNNGTHESTLHEILLNV